MTTKRPLRWLPGLVLLGAVSAATAQPCCECRCPGNEGRACSEDFGLDESTYLEVVCEPLGCSVAFCADRACARSNRCPRSEEGRCGDGFDNDADGLFDCDDDDCADDSLCTGEPPPSPTPASTPPQQTPATSATPTPRSDCCASRTSPGCEIAACERCVCGLDGFCCSELWDSVCVDGAKADCASACQCAGGTTPTPTATPRPSVAATPAPTSAPTTARDCCVGRLPEDGPGCALPDCESCVCALDDFCCTEIWDQNCAGIAEVECPSDCACAAAPTATPERSPTDRTRPPAPPTAPRTATRVPTPNGNGGGGNGGANSDGTGSCTVQPPAGRDGFPVELIFVLLLWTLARRGSRRTSAPRQRSIRTRRKVG